MKISVIGTGYVGLISGVCFASLGHAVTCIDTDKVKVARFNRGEPVIYEPGLEEALKKNLNKGRISFSSDYESLKDSEIIIIAVGTPAQDDGSSNLRDFFAAIEKSLPLLKDNTTLVIKSTVPVGTANKVRAFLEQKDKANLFVVNNPEFLREGSAINDFLEPDRIVVGYREDEALRIMKELYGSFIREGFSFIAMDSLSAELTKYAANSFLATKISFINEIAKLCDVVGASIENVRQGISSDHRIGSHFLYPGPGYGGSCFPKDIKALVNTGEEHSMPLHLIKATEEVNGLQKEYFIEKVKSFFAGSLKGKKIAVWGLAFKANTDDIRESPAIKIIKSLSESGAEMTVYDPMATQNFLNLMESEEIQLLSTKDKYDALQDKDALVVLTEWKEFKVPDWDILKQRLKSPLIFDARNLYSKSFLRSQGFSYISIG